MLYASLMLFFVKELQAMPTETPPSHWPLFMWMIETGNNQSPVHRQLWSSVSCRHCGYNSVMIFSLRILLVDTTLHVITWRRSPWRGGRIKTVNCLRGPDSKDLCFIFQRCIIYAIHVTANMGIQHV